MTYEEKQDAIRTAFETSVLRRRPGISLARTATGDYDNPMVAAMWECWYEGMAYQAAQGSDTATTNMTPEQAHRWAWKEVKQGVGIDGWTMGDTCNFMGFFHWGWTMRGQYELQRMALPSKTAGHDILTWRDRVGGCSRPLGEVEQAMDQENLELREFIALHLSRLSPLAFQQREFDLETQMHPASDDASRVERAVLSAKAEGPELRAMLLAYKNASWDKQEQLLKDILVFVNSKLKLTERIASQTRATRAFYGERITNKSFQTLSSLSTFMSVALSLLPTVSWHDGATRACEELTDMLDRNFAVQLTTEEGQRMRYTPVSDKLRTGELELPAPLLPTSGLAEKYIQGFNNCLNKVIALNNVPDPELRLPPELAWTDNSSAAYIVGFNTCRKEIQRLNLELA